MKKPKILIVDDERINIELLHHALKDLYTVIPALFGNQVLELAKKEKPDLILLDIVMPDIDGHQVCTMLKNDTETMAIPVIFVTAQDAVEDELVGLKLGACDYFRKPFVLPLMRARIKNQIDLAHKTKLLEEMAWVDGLTGISNRRMFDVKLAEACRYAQRNERSIALMLIDIDFFKQYNDHYGHALGDEVLKTVAQTLKKGAGRPFDVVARYGGEEFAILLVDTYAQDGALVAEKVRESIENLHIEHAASDIHQVVTISVGLSTSPTNTKLIDQSKLIEAADTRLYQAKGMGRNCVVSDDFRPVTR